ncbi:MAG TPA: hypothetical protein PKC18_15070, partial [Lacipirellulaceae bacterium]|nr:hypothetical protein [Lacipirellulaceae bacterium]
MQKRHLGVSWGLWTACLAAAVAAPPRALPPGPLEADDVFFEDARASLAGERESDPAAAQGDEDQVGDDDAPDWSAIITGDALADEVKRLALSLDEPLASQATFGAGGHVRCRDTFSLLSILFAVVAEHEEQPRWHADAPAVRDALADAAAACRAGDNQAYAAALAQRQQLDDLIRGARIAGPASPLGRWSELSERGPLMRRLQLAVDERIGPALTDLRTFNRSVEHLDHESRSRPQCRGGGCARLRRVPCRLSRLVAKSGAFTPPVALRIIRPLTAPRASHPHACRRPGPPRTSRHHWQRAGRLVGGDLRSAG